MKVVFPCKGSLVLLKKDLETLQSFYVSNLSNSKIFDTYKTSNIMVQVGNFNYMPQKSKLVLHNANVLTIHTMRKILGIYKKSSHEEPSQNPILNNNTTTPISDNDLLSNPFFQTLKPLN